MTSGERGGAIKHLNFKRCSECLPLPQMSFLVSTETVYTHTRPRRGCSCWCTQNIVTIFAVRRRSTRTRTRSRLRSRVWRGRRYPSRRGRGHRHELGHYIQIWGAAAALFGIVTAAAAVDVCGGRLR